MKTIETESGSVKLLALHLLFAVEKTIGHSFFTEL